MMLAGFGVSSPAGRRAIARSGEQAASDRRTEFDRQRG